MASISNVGQSANLYNMFKKVKRQGNFRRKIKNQLHNILNHSSVNRGIVASDSVIDNHMPEKMNIEAPALECEEIELNNLMCDDSDIECEQSDFDGCLRDGDYGNDYSDIQLIFREKLSKWAINVGANHYQVRELLAVCNETLPFKLPVDPRTIFGTPKSVSVQDIAGGQYWHRGLIECLHSKLKRVNVPPSKISLNINMDGLPIHESSNHQFWPILFNIHELYHIEPGVIGIFFGKSMYLFIIIRCIYTRYA